jgi:hypothetical protein
MSTDWYPPDKDTNGHFAQRVSLAEAYRCGVLAGEEAEREACAKVCEDEEELQGHTPFDCALRIRARGENT